METCTNRRWVMLGAALAFSLAGVAVLGGGVLTRHGEAVRQGQVERSVPWAAYLRKVDEALSQNDPGAAERAWYKAYDAALGSDSWRGLVSVGNAVLRIGEIAGGRQGAEAKAREAYLAALSRARHEESLEGLLTTAEAFAALGDRQMVEQSLNIAELSAAQDPEAQADVRTVRERLAVLLASPPP